MKGVVVLCGVVLILGVILTASGVEGRRVDPKSTMDWKKRHTKSGRVKIGRPSALKVKPKNKIGGKRGLLNKRVVRNRKTGLKQKSVAGTKTADVKVGDGKEKMKMKMKMGEKQKMPRQPCQGGVGYCHTIQDPCTGAGVADRSCMLGRCCVSQAVADAVKKVNEQKTADAAAAAAAKSKDAELQAKLKASTAQCKRINRDKTDIQNGSCVKDPNGCKQVVPGLGCPAEQYCCFK